MVVSRVANHERVLTASRIVKILKHLKLKKKSIRINIQTFLITNICPENEISNVSIDSATDAGELRESRPELKNHRKFLKHISTLFPTPDV